MKDKYFESLNYTLANEDARLEYSLLNEQSPHVVAVGGSGGRVLPLLAKRPKKLTILDVSVGQLALCELRFETLRAFSYEEFISFWGFYAHSSGPLVMSPAERKRKFYELSISEKAKSTLIVYFDRHGWSSLLLSGKWERTFLLISKVIKKIIGKQKIEKFFSITSLEEHRLFLKTEFPRLRWRLLLALIGNANTFNALLYRGSFPKKNIPGTMQNYYLKAFDRLFEQNPARYNFFLQLCFLGGLKYQEGLPIETDREVFENAKQALSQTHIQYVQGDMIAWLESLSEKSVEEKASFVSLSNISSYFSGPLEADFLQRIRGGLGPEATVVLRYYLRVPEGIVLKGYQDQSAIFQNAIQAERVQMYQVQVLQTLNEGATT